MGEQTGTRTVAAPVADADEMARLVDAAIELAPRLVRQRQVLPAIDWKQVPAGKVDRLLERLASAGVKPPAWLAQSLLVAGHRLEADVTGHLAPPLQLLAALNLRDAGSRIEPWPADIEEAALDAEVATAIVSRLAKLGDAAAACRLALAQWPRLPAVLRPVRNELARHIEGLPILRLHIAGFSTTHPFAEALTPALAGVGRRAEVSEAPFGDVIGQLMHGAVDADALVILLDFEGLYGNDWRQGLDVAAARAAERRDALIAALRGFAQRSSVPVFVTTLPVATLPGVGHVDRSHAAGSARLVGDTNAALAALAASTPAIALVDADMALAAIAPVGRSDAKLAFYGRLPFSEDATRALAASVAAVWRDRHRPLAKVLALDFDNTLWGGVYGDDGLDGLSCGDDFPGNAFKAFQQEALRLKAQGMLLVGLSKNNADAIEVFSRHHGMALSAGDFAATAIDWEPKPVNIARLARELNLGLDSFVFLDDSPHEREAMRRMCPTVIVPEMPVDPALRPAWFRGLRCTWPLRLTEEDLQRSDMYAAERKARALKDSAATFEDYLAGLEQRLILADVGPSSLARVAQLHQRTNQFNLTTRRFTEAELTALVADRDRAVVLQGRVADKFGDHGITIATVATIAGRSARIESFLMSCRVMGRQIETACLGVLIERLVARGVEEIVGDYRPTAKNAMVRDFFRVHGFVESEVRDEGTTWRWRKDVCEVPRSAFVAVTINEA